jgi:hypothetical protein
VTSHTSAIPPHPVGFLRWWQIRSQQGRQHSTARGHNREGSIGEQSRPASPSRAQQRLCTQSGIHSHMAPPPALHDASPYYWLATSVRPSCSPVWEEAGQVFGPPPTHPTGWRQAFCPPPHTIDWWAAHLEHRPRHPPPPQRWDVVTHSLGWITLQRMALLNPPAERLCNTMRE